MLPINRPTYTKPEITRVTRPVNAGDACAPSCSAGAEEEGRLLTLRLLLMDAAEPAVAALEG